LEGNTRNTNIGLTGHPLSQQRATVTQLIEFCYSWRWFKASALLCCVSSHVRRGLPDVEL